MMKWRTALLIAITACSLLSCGLSTTQAQEGSPSPAAGQPGTLMVIIGIKPAPMLHNWWKSDADIGDLYGSMLLEHLKSSKRFSVVAGKERLTQAEIARKEAAESGKRPTLKPVDYFLRGTILELTYSADSASGFGAPPPQAKKEGKGGETLKISCIISLTNTMGMMVWSAKSSTDIPYDGKTPFCPSAVTSHTDKSFTDSPLGTLLEKCVNDAATKIENAQIRELPPAQK
jgi:curli biogenesis system outer membrane secretion channel CsgG